LISFYYLKQRSTKNPIKSPLLKKEVTGKNGEYDPLNRNSLDRVNVGRMRRLISLNNKNLDASAPRRALISQTLTPPFL